jgi:hypothetical protein
MVLNSRLFHQVEAVQAPLTANDTHRKLQVVKDGELGGVKSTSMEMDVVRDLLPNATKLEKRML